MTTKLIVYAVKTDSGTRDLMNIGVGFAHRDHKGVSLKFDIYPPDNDDSTIVVRYRNSPQEWRHTPHYPIYDLCLVKEKISNWNGVAWNKWSKIGQALPHEDGLGWTLQFRMRPSRYSIESGHNIVLRAPDKSSDSCDHCGRS